MGGAHHVAQLGKRVEGQWPAERTGERPQDRPVLARLAGRKHGLAGELNPALGVDVDRVFLRVGTAGQHDIGAGGAAIPVVTLIDYKGQTGVREVDLVGPEHIEQLDRARPAAFQNPGNIAAARPRYEAEIEAADPRCGAVQHVEAVPFRPDHAKRLGDGPTGTKNASAIEPGERPLPQDDHRRLRSAQQLGPSAFAARQGVQCLTAFAESLDREGQVVRGANRRDAETAPQVALAQTRVDERGFPARVGADEQADIGAFNAGNRRVEQIAGAATGIEERTILAAIEIGRAKARKQFLQRVHRLRVAKITSDRGDALARRSFQAIGNEIERLLPLGLDQLAIAPDIRPVQPAPHEPVDRKAGLVRDPLLIDVLVEARQHTQDLRAAGIDADVAADRVEDVDRLCLAQLPRPRDIGVRLRGQRADRAQINDITG